MYALIIIIVVACVVCVHAVERLANDTPDNWFED